MKIRELKGVGEKTEQLFIHFDKDTFIELDDCLRGKAISKVAKENGATEDEVKLSKSGYIKINNKSGINVEFSGNVSSSTVLSHAQDIVAGETVPLGQIVTVYFRDEASADMTETDVNG